MVLLVGELFPVRAIIYQIHIEDKEDPQCSEQDLGRLGLHSFGSRTSLCRILLGEI
jgi:hypothetical protein